MPDPKCVFKARTAKNHDSLPHGLSIAFHPKTSNFCIRDLKICAACGVSWFGVWARIRHGEHMASTVKAEGRGWQGSSVVDRTSRVRGAHWYPRMNVHAGVCEGARKRMWEARYVIAHEDEYGNMRAGGRNAAPCRLCVEGVVYAVDVVVSIAGYSTMSGSWVRRCNVQIERARSLHPPGFRIVHQPGSGLGRPCTGEASPSSVVSMSAQMGDGSAMYISAGVTRPRLLSESTDRRALNDGGPQRGCMQVVYRAGVENEGRLALRFTRTSGAASDEKRAAQQPVECPWDLELMVLR
ncbi:hypothetical protein B0H17DRAFT_1223963 [Mycena rosella]|uniref:Uncharacterized protein n=1 Tax=Mycena rosella TaxID=1033263 RepID=A0AAD7H391_MYCRO|nr:hypothetical protein B0H17DRAFT_1223963 [Mycena rosella]